MPRVRKIESISSKNTMTGQAFLAPLLGALEDLADLPLGLADVLVQQLRPLDVQEVAACVARGRSARRPCSASDFATAFAISVLPQPGGSVEQDALRRLQLVLVEQLGVQERQLHGVADRLDLALEAADVLVADVGDLLEDELLDLFLRAGARWPRRSGGRTARCRRRASARASRSTGEVATCSSSPRPTTITRSSPSRSLTLTTSPARSGSRTSTTFSDSFKTTCDARSESAVGRSRVRHHAHLAAGGEHVDRAVVVGARGTRRTTPAAARASRPLRASASIFSFSARNASASFWFWPIALARSSRVSTSFSSRIVTWRGALVRRRRSSADLVLQELHLGLEFVDLLLVLLDCPAVAHLSTSPERPARTRPSAAPGSAPISCYRRSRAGNAKGSLTCSAGSPDRSQPASRAGDGKEARMAHHPVVRTDAPLGDVPAALQRLEGLHVVEPGRASASTSCWTCTVVGR